MTKHLLLVSFTVALLTSCISTAHNDTSDHGRRNNLTTTSEAVTSGFHDIDTSSIVHDMLPANVTPLSLLDQPRTESGEFALSPGFYETDFKTYCLQPGTPGPSLKDAYFQASLVGQRKGIIESILINSQGASHLEQKNIQLLLWSVVSRSDFDKLSPAVKSTAAQLLTPKQLFELKGGVLGVVKTVAKAVPINGNKTINDLFNVGVQSYEAYERLAITSGSSEISRPGFKREQWNKHSDGYYVRYMPTNYKQSRIQVYVPASAITVSDSTDSFITFNPASTVVVAANSNAQRLGIGGPLLELGKTVIKVISKKKKPQPQAPPPPPPAPTSSKHPKMS